MAKAYIDHFIESWKNEDEECMKKMFGIGILIQTIDQMEEGDLDMISQVVGLQEDGE